MSRGRQKICKIKTAGKGKRELWDKESQFCFVFLGLYLSETVSERAHTRTSRGRGRGRMWGAIQDPEIATLAEGRRLTD